MIRKFVLLSVLVFSFSASNRALASASVTRERSVHVYECKGDFLLGRLWMRWLKVNTVRVSSVPRPSLTCTRPQIWGGNVCHQVVDQAGESVSCGWSHSGLIAYGR